MNRDNKSYSPECMRMLEIMSFSDVEKPHVYLILPELGGVRHMEYVEELARAHYKSSGIRRSFSKYYVYSVLPRNCSDREYLEFYDKPRTVAEHYNSFKGVFCIDLTEYLDSLDAPVFQMMIDYVKARIREIMFIFIVSSNDKSKIAQMFKTLKRNMRHIRIEQVDMVYEDVNTYVGFASETIRNAKLKVNDEMRQVMTEYIDALMQNKTFAGFDSVTRFCDDLIYEMRLSKKRNLSNDDLVRIKDVLIAENNSEDIIKRIGF